MSHQSNNSTILGPIGRCQAGGDLSTAMEVPCPSRECMPPHSMVMNVVSIGKKPVRISIFLEQQYIVAITETQWDICAHLAKLLSFYITWNVNNLTYECKMVYLFVRTHYVKVQYNMVYLFVTLTKSNHISCLFITRPVNV